MKAGLIIAVIIVLCIIAYFYIIKKEKPLSITGYADNEVVGYLNGVNIFESKDWSKRFDYAGLAKTGDEIKIVVKNVGGPGGLVCSLNWDSKMLYSNADLFTTATPVNNCAAADVKSWYGNINMDRLTESKWIWAGNCNDGTGSSITNPSIRTFIYKLP